MGGRPQREVPATVAADLSPFLPRLIPEWIASSPEARHRTITGTLVFTDLSGFTALSERLAARGKVGAEHLTDHLDATFTELLKVAGGFGGSLLKFGGDALLLFFWGEDHEARAAQAAVDMQATLDRIGRISTPDGEVVLRMSVGAHRGDFDFFLVGETHRELFVAGPDAGRTVGIESQAGAGEIRLSPELAGRLDPSLLADRMAGAPLLTAGPGLVSVEPPAVAWPSGADSSRFVPSMLAEHLTAGVELAEHRQMVVAFLHLCDFDGLMSVIGAERAADSLHALVVQTQEILGAHDVAFVSTDVYEQGPKIICASGAVRTFEDDDERMLRALREIADHHFDIGLRIGVHRGHGFCGYVGPSFRRTFVTIGDVVNTAARVMSKAGPGEILSTAGPLALSAAKFATVELPPFAAKGKAEPLVANRVGEIIEDQDARNLEAIPMVDREREIGALMPRLEALRGGRGGVVDLVGEAGIGKTRLIVELALSYTWVAPHESRCGRYAASTPFFPFRRLLADVVGGRGVDELRSKVVEVAPRLEPDLPLIGLALGLDIELTPGLSMLSPDERRVRLHRAVAGFLEATVTEPTGWLIDDAQWLDPASAGLIRHLSVSLDETPLVIFVARRPSDLEALTPNGPMELGPLPDEAAGTLVRAACTKHLLPKEVAHLIQRGHGNAHFLIELAAAVSSGADFDHLPDSLEAMLAERIDALPPRDRRVLRHLAVLGNRFAPAVASEVVDDIPVVRLVEFVDFADDEWRFRHNLVRDTAYEGLPFRERREVHARAGRAIVEHFDADEVCELLSLHFHQGGIHDESLAYSKAAAARAERAFASTEVVTFLGRAAEAADALGDPLELSTALTGLAWAEFAVGDLASATTHFEESAFLKRGTGNLNGVAGSLSGLGTVARARGEYAVAQGHFEECLAVLKGLSDGEFEKTASFLGIDADTLRNQQLGACLNNLGAVAWLQGDYSRAQASFEEALTVRRDQGDLAGIASSLDTLGTVAATLGDNTEALERYEESLTLKREIGDKPGLAGVLNNLAQVATRLGRMDDARSWSEESLEIREGIGDRDGVASTRNSLAAMAYHQGELVAARAHVDEGLRIAREVGSPTRIGACLQTLGSIEVADGAVSDAIAHLEEALEISRGLGDPRQAGQALQPLADAYLDSEDPGRACVHLKEALEAWAAVGDAHGTSTVLDSVAGACAALGDPARAACLLGAAKRLSTSDPIPTAARRERLATDLRRTMGPDTFAEQQTLGLGIDLERAVELASTFLEAQLASGISA